MRTSGFMPKPAVDCGNKAKWLGNLSEYFLYNAPIVKVDTNKYISTQKPILLNLGNNNAVDFILYNILEYIDESISIMLWCQKKNA